MPDPPDLIGGCRWRSAILGILSEDLTVDDVVSGLRDLAPSQPSPYQAVSYLSCRRIIPTRDQTRCTEIQYKAGTSWLSYVLSSKGPCRR